MRPPASGEEHASRHAWRSRSLRTSSGSADRDRCFSTNAALCPDRLEAGWPPARTRCDVGDSTGGRETTVARVHSLTGAALHGGCCANGWKTVEVLNGGTTAWKASRWGCHPTHRRLSGRLQPGRPITDRRSGSVDGFRNSLHGSGQRRRRCWFPHEQARAGRRQGRPWLLSCMARGSDGGAVDRRRPSRQGRAAQRRTALSHRRKPRLALVRDPLRRHGDGP